VDTLSAYCFLFLQLLLYYNKIISKLQFCYHFIVAVDCLDPPAVNNSNSDIPSTVFNFTVTYECEEGYAFNPDFVQDNEASQTTMEITCSANGTWLPDVTHCLRKFTHLGYL